METPTGDHHAWQAYGQITFWLHKKEMAFAESYAKCLPLLSKLRNELPFEAVDPLMHLDSVEVKLMQPLNVLSTLFAQFQKEIREILEFGLRNNRRLSTLFIRGHDRLWQERTCFIIESLGEVGDANTIKLLGPLLESREFGRSTETALRKIKNR